MFQRRSTLPFWLERVVMPAASILYRVRSSGSGRVPAAGGAILVVGLLPRLRASARTAGFVAAAGLAVAVALIAGGSRFLGAKATALFQFGSGSSVSQRYGYWSAAVHLAVHHPIVGTGPDTYAVTYAQYQDASLAKVLGNTFFVNSAHNIFLSWLANEGVPGFILILAVFAFGVAWGARAWLSWRTEDDAETIEKPGPTPTETRRYLVAGLVAAFVAYFVQASFDVEQVGTLFMLFMVLGLLGVVTRSVWPVAGLTGHPFGFRGSRSDSDEPKAELDSAYPTHGTPVGRSGRSRARTQSDVRRLTATLVAAVIGATAVGLTFWRTDALWRADHLARVGTQSSVTRATQLNPWEPSYFQSLGEGAAAAYGQNPKAPDALTVIQDAVAFFRDDVALDGSNSFAQEEYGDALASEGTLVNSKALLRMALTVYHRALQEDPFNAQVRISMAEAQKALG